MALFRKVQPTCFPLSAGRSIQTLARTATYERFSSLWSNESGFLSAPRLPYYSINCTSWSDRAVKRRHFILWTQSNSSFLAQCSYFHTQCCGVLAPKDDKPANQRGSKGQQESGSVLMQFVEKKDEPKQLTVGAKVVQAGKDFTYLLVILGGFAVTGFLLWSVSSEFFSSASPSSIFTKALKRVKADSRVIEVLGEPITGHGEASGRGRRRHIAHQEYVVDGAEYMRVQFYVDGSKRKGTAHLDLRKNDQGKYECRFLFVELQGYPPGTIIIEDNR